MTSSALNLMMPSLDGYPSIGGMSGKTALPEIPGLTSLMPPSQLMPMSMAPQAPMSVNQALYSDLGYGDIGTGLPIPDSSLIGQSAGQGLFDRIGLGGLGSALGGLGQTLRDSGAFGRINADGSRDMGWGGLAVNLGQSLIGGYMGYQNLQLAKKQLAFQKDAFNKNWNAQKTAMNSSLEDRQRARVASNANAYESVDSYMAKNRIA